MSDNHVVYRHYVGDVTIYIGVGSRARATDFRHRSRQWHEYVAQFGEPSVEILYEDLTRAAAWAIDELLIAEHKRTADGGTLINQAIGGIGASGVKQSAESKARKSAALKGRERTPEHRAALSAALKGRRPPPQAIAASAAAMSRPEVREKIGNSKRGHKQSAETIAKRSASLTGRSRPPHVIAAMQAGRAAARAAKLENHGERN